MFNISFGEILVFSILALIILGPEKLPQALRSAAIKYRNIKNAVNKIQQDFENELELVELKRLMEVELKKIKENEEHLKAQLTQMQNEIDQLNEDITLVDDKSKITYQYQLITSSPFQVPYLANQSFMFNVVRNAA